MRKLPRRPRVGSIVAGALIAAGCLWLAATDRLVDRWFGPNPYRDVRRPLLARPAVTPLPSLGPGEWGVWIEFADPPPDLGGVTWEVTTTDLDTGAVVDRDNELGASFHSGAGTSGERVGRLRLGGGRRYGQVVRAEGADISRILARQPMILLMAPPGPRQIHGLRRALRLAGVGGVGLLLVAGGAIVGRGAGAVRRPPP